MKTVFAILFLCSVAVSQQAAAPQSSKLVGDTVRFEMGTSATSANVIKFEPPTTVATKGEDGHWHLAEGKTLDDVIAVVARTQSDSEGWNSALNDQTEKLLLELDREQAETRRQRDIAEGWLHRYATALELSQAIMDCTKAIINDRATTDASPVCQKKYALMAILKGPLPGEAIQKKPKAGAQPAATGKPATEKTKKKKGEASR